MMLLSPQNVSICVYTLGVCDVYSVIKDFLSV